MAASMTDRTDFRVSAAVLVLALAFGGAGAYFPLLEMLLELSGLVVLLYFALDGRRYRLGSEARLPLVILALLLLLPLLQLLPLPPQLFALLPGREFVMHADDVVGLSTLWRPISLDPEATLRSFFVLLPPASLFVAMLSLSTKSRLRLAGIVVGFALFGVALGALQLASGDGSSLTPFASSHLGNAVGLFVNRNHQATFLLASIPLAAAIGAGSGVAARNRPAVLLVTMAVTALLALGAIVTTSRMGTALVPIALLSAALILVDGRVGWKRTTLVVVGLGAIAFLIAQSAVVGRTIARFASIDDARFLYWDNVLWALREYGLVGTGFGSFPAIYQSVEPLDSLVPPVINHAHNDFLELLLEGGIPAILLVALFQFWLGLAARRLRARAGSDRARHLALAGFASIALILLHSLTDYPLRMTALATLFAFLCGLLVPTRASPAQTTPAASVRRGGQRRRAMRAAISILLAGLFGWQVVAAGMSERALLRRDYESAIAWAPWSADARARRATQLLLAGDVDRAAVQARAAFAIAPINAPALRTLGFAAEAGEEHRSAYALLATAGALGWRDVLTQLWLMQQALDSGEPNAAMERADALLRQGILSSEIFAELRRLGRSRAVNAALAARLAGGPWWRHPFLADVERTDPSQFGVVEALLLRLMATSAPPTIEETRPFLRRLAKAHDYARARRIWLRIQPDALVYDSGFEASGKTLAYGGPFEWQAPKRAGVELNIGEPSGSSHGKALRLVSDGSARGIALRQTLLLKPGAYRLEFAIRAEQPDVPSSLKWQLWCIGTQQNEPFVTSSQIRNGWAQVSGSVAVPEKGCVVQQLRLSTTTGQAISAWIDDVRISAAEPKDA